MNAPSSAESADVSRVGLVGPGRLGTAMAAALAAAGLDVDGPVGRGERPSGDAVLLCVPDAEIPRAAAAVAGTAPLVGHTSGATPLAALDAAARAGAEVFGLHPLQTFSAARAPDATGSAAPRLAGCGCAVAGGSPRALAVAAALARRLGMAPFEIDDARRPAYHAAASIASNFLVTLEDLAESLAASAGIPAADARALLSPLVRTTVDNWAALGPERALTGPVARGDEPTIARQREAVRHAEPSSLPLFDALVERTRALAGRDAAAAPAAIGGLA